MDRYKKVIIEKRGNIGALCGFLKSPKNKDYLEYLKSNINDEILNYDLSISEIIYYYFNNIQEPILCSCGDHRKYIGFKNGYRTSCGKKECYVKQRKLTCLKKYGVDNPKKSKEILLKEQDNIKKKYNGKHYMEDSDVREKFNTTMEDRYGVKWAQQNESISKKRLETWSNKTDSEKKEIIIKRLETWNCKSDLEIREIKDRKIKTIENKYGSVSNMYRGIQEKIREVSKVKYNVDHFFMSDIVINKRVNSYKKKIINKYLNKLPISYKFKETEYNKNNTDSYFHIYHKECDKEFKITRQLLNKRIDNNEDICLVCNPVSNGYSKLEKDILQVILDNYEGEVLENDTSLGIELDIFIPKLNLAIEVNGNYWHSELYKDSKFHLNKTNICEDNDIQLIHIFEDEWLYKKDIVISRLLNLIGSSKKVYARKCIVKEITDNNKVKEFIISNHIQGFVGSKVKLGLYYKDELVSIMTFSNLRSNLGNENSDSEKSYELLRFCNLLNTAVVGGASRLFKYFIRNYNPEMIISYADRRWSRGKLYEKLGFRFTHYSNPNYFYCDPRELIRLNRFNFGKDRLISEGYDSSLTEREIMSNRGFLRIYDCGNLVFRYLK